MEIHSKVETKDRHSSDSPHWCVSLLYLAVLYKDIRSIIDITMDNRDNHGNDLPKLGDHN